MSRYWVRTPEKQSAGPFTPKQIVKLPWVSEETMVYPEFAAGAGAGATAWQHIREVPELLKLVSPPPPAEPEPAPAPKAPPPAPPSLVPKLALLALAAAGAAFGYRYWRASQKKAETPPTPPVAAAPAEPPAPPPSPADMAGYKNSRWGMTREEAHEALETPLTEIPEFMGSTKSPAVDGAVNSLFYELWGVPKSSEAYEDGDIPDRFTQAKSASGDVASFYGDKLFAYSFEVQPQNFDESLRTLAGKYGPGRAATLTLMQPGAPPREAAVRTWERGRTLIHLSRETWTEGGEKMTAAHLLYESRELRKQVVDAVQASAEQNRLMRRVKEEAERQDQLKKLE